MKIQPISPFRAAGEVARAVVEVAKLRQEGKDMQTEFTLDELKALRRIADASRATPAGPAAMWQSIFEKLSHLIAAEVCREKPLELPAQDDQNAA